MKLVCLAFALAWIGKKSLVQTTNFLLSLNFIKFDIRYPLQAKELQLQMHGSQYYHSFLFIDFKRMLMDKECKQCSCLNAEIQQQQSSRSFEAKPKGVTSDAT